MNRAIIPVRLFSACLCIVTMPFAVPAFTYAQAAGTQEADRHAGHGGHDGHGVDSSADEPPVERPKIFLDKSPRIVAYQLKRLDNQRLLLVERNDTDPKYIPVYGAILTRAGISPQVREEAVAALAKLQSIDAVEVLLAALAEFDADDLEADRQTQRTAGQLSRQLLSQSTAGLASHADALRAATEADSSAAREVGYAGLVAAGLREQAMETALRNSQALVALLQAVKQVPSPSARLELRPFVVAQLQHADLPVRQAAVLALAAIPGPQAETFQLVAPLVQQADMRAAAVETLLQVPNEQRDATVAAELLATLVDYAEQTPAAGRTSDAFIDAMQLADQSMAAVAPTTAKAFRERLRAVTVRVVRIKTVEEEMRYDTPYFAVEAGRPVQVVLDNEDLMPHNLVLTVPGALKEVAQLGLAVGPTGGWQGKQYVPESDKVLHATPMVPAGAQQRLTFDAPLEPGEYPYVCTFPQHWQRMYGVMVVVEDLDAWLQNPTKPTDPIGSNRSFVKNWRVDDLAASLSEGLRGRSPEIGKRIFAEASCLNCHQMDGQGGAVGPALTDVFKRWKGDAEAVLKEILEPSHRIDPKYAVHVIVTVDGRTLTGLVIKEDQDEVALLENPEAKQPTIVAQDDIDEMVKTATSMMPKALMDQYTQDEIFELMAYLRGVPE